MPVLMKSIRPAKFRKKAFRLEFLNAARKAGTVVKSDFEKTTATWDHKPKFVVVVSIAKVEGGVSTLVDTDDEIYFFVSKGTEEHVIEPKKPGGVLRFRSEYSPKTKPDVIGSFAGGPSGNFVFAKFVIHPGTKARRFDEVIAEKRRKWYKKQMEAAMKRGAMKSGHAIG